jgi:hypothetical protein
MGDSAEAGARRVEVHFASDDEAMVLELSEDPDGNDVDQLIGALHATDINDAERRLGGTTAGPRPIGRIAPHRR